MSMRPRRAASYGAATTRFDPELLRSELDLMRTTALAETAEAAAGIQEAAPNDASSGILTQAMRDFDSLTPTEQQAATLGVHPDSFRPLKELNAQHFKALRMANALSPQLEASIKAFQSIAEA